MTIPLKKTGLPGEAYLIRLGAFGMFGHTASWRIYDLKKGVVREGGQKLESPCDVRYNARSIQNIYS